MPTLASCSIIGHLYEAPKKIGTGERTGASFRFYTTDRVKGDDGEYGKQFTSHSGVIWGKEAEWLIRDGKKGSLIACAGTFRVRKWEKDGRAGAGTDIQCQSAKILNREEEDQAEKPAPARARPVAPAAGGEDEPPF